MNLLLVVSVVVSCVMLSVWFCVGRFLVGVWLLL